MVPYHCTTGTTVVVISTQRWVGSVCVSSEVREIRLELPAIPTAERLHQARGWWTALHHAFLFWVPVPRKLGEVRPGVRLKPGRRALARCPPRDG